MNNLYIVYLGLVDFNLQPSTESRGLYAYMYICVYGFALPRMYVRFASKLTVYPICPDMKSHITMHSLGTR
jgi:hypothetical protein